MKGPNHKRNISVPSIKYLNEPIQIVPNYLMKTPIAAKLFEIPILDKEIYKHKKNTTSKQDFLSNRQKAILQMNSFGKAKTGSFRLRRGYTAKKYTRMMHIDSIPMPTKKDKKKKLSTRRLSYFDDRETEQRNIVFLNEEYKNTFIPESLQLESNNRSRKAIFSRFHPSQCFESAPKD